MSVVRVRGAEPSDLDWLVGQCKEFSAFFGSRLALFGDESFARATLTAIIEKHLLLVAEKEGTLLGFIAGLLVPHTWNPGIMVLTEAFWWVAEEHRRGRAGLMLLDAYIAWGRENAHWITMTLEHHSPVNPETLTRRGFRHQESTYLLEVA